ncbi:prepilin peptidase [Gimesia panareensis]|uniref:Type IV leader peptidase family protein n=1 Tax=Gimesia panareensis TaxID=2527978 RepID=A0A517Q2N5_9PLAN|nr:A24 family peptidase [Gimesia panareensis]QDT25852.1 Type IV leader peptidase family protein [Gimesia panareensis]QDU48789.1 Type IV leader peptidase family protein [Gimesia panareensis]
MDFELTQLSLYVMAISVGIFTIIAAITDYKARKIYNVLTVPFFGLGIIYQLAFNGWEGLLYGFLGFAAGFGAFFLIWMAGSGAAGDVKMMGALAMWLGFKATLAVMIIGTVFVVVGSFAVLFWSVVTKGARKTKEKYLATGKQLKGKKKKYKPETEKQKLERGLMPFALPVVLATWSVTTWMIIKAAVL